MKKIFIISSIFLGFMLIFWAIYNLAFLNDNKLSSKETDSLSVEELKKEVKKDEIFREQKTATLDQKIAPVSVMPILSPTLDLDGKHILFYSKNDGTAWKVSLNGQEKEFLSQDNIPGLSSVIWSPDRKKVITRFENGNFYLYNYETNSGIKLKNGIDQVSWTNLGDKIVYVFTNFASGEKTLNIANQDGSNWKELQKINYKNISVALIPHSSLISFWNSPDVSQSTSFNITSLVGGEFKNIFSEKFGADYLWSPDGKKVLVSFWEGENKDHPVLGVMNQEGKNFQDLHLPAFVSKCAWSNKESAIYCALPVSLPSGPNTFSDYQSGKLKTRDTFWKIDIESGKKERLIELSELKESYDGAELFLSSSENELFFINRYDGKLYRILL